RARMDKRQDKIQNRRRGATREREIEEREQARLRRLPLTPGAGQTGIGDQGAHGALPEPTLLGRAAAVLAEREAVPPQPAAGIGPSGTGAGMHGPDPGAPPPVPGPGRPPRGPDPAAPRQRR